MISIQTHFKDEKDQVAIFNEEDFCDEEDITVEDEDEEDTDIAG